jgi:phage tail sheath protein FI
MPSYLSPGVYVEEVDSGSRPIEGVGTAVAAFIGFARKGPLHEPTPISNWTQFKSVFGDFAEGAYLPGAVYGFFANGGGICYVVRIGAPESDAQNEPAELTGGEPTRLGPYEVRALPQATGQITVEVTEPEGEDPPQDTFGLVVRRDGEVVETYPKLTTKRSKDNAATQVRSRSQYIALAESQQGPAPQRPEAQQVAVPAAAPGPLEVSASSYTGDPEQRTGVAGLEAVEEVTMVAAPDLMSAYQSGRIDAEQLISVQQAIVTHCELMGDRVAILDPPPAMTPQQVKVWRERTAAFDSKYAALYYPWIKVFDPSVGRDGFVPPSGHIAGVWARSDETRGVHKAPANEVVRGAVALQTQVTKGEHDLLNPAGVNCVRVFPGRGIRVWGARTLSSDPSWRYLNVRRLFNYLEESILGGTQWAVFEPNDDALWAKIRRTISAFLVNEWRKGALFGLTPDEAFYVKCDAETNPPEAIDAGQVVCEVGVAPVKPAEFVVFRLAQMSAGSGAVDE